MQNAKRFFGCALVMLMAGFIFSSIAIAQDAVKVPPPNPKQLALERLNVVLTAKPWIVYLAPSGESQGKGMAVVDETLTFADGKMTSAHLSARGYNVSNYTPTLREDGVWILETMQRTTNDDIAFWHIELAGESMTGVVGIHPVKGGVEEYSFNQTKPAPVVKAAAKGKKK